MENFDRIATPRDGRYVREPVIYDPTGAPAYIPPPVRHPVARFAATLAVLGLAAGAASLLFNRDDS